MKIAFKNDQKVENNNFNMSQVAEAFNSSSVDRAYLEDKFLSKKHPMEFNDVGDMIDATMSQEFHSRTLGLS